MKKKINSTPRSFSKMPPRKFAKKRSFKKKSFTKKRTYKKRGGTYRRKYVKKRRLLPSLGHTEVNRNVIYPRTHMKMRSEIVVGGIILKNKEFLVPTNEKMFGCLMFPMNTITGPGTYNPGLSSEFNPMPLTGTTQMPNMMGSAAQAERYMSCLPTFSSIAVTINMTLPDFYRTGSTGADAIYDSTFDECFYFCLVPFNSVQVFNPTMLRPSNMPWAQAIRQPGARRMMLRCKTGRVSGTLRASTNIGRLEGTPSWETDPLYRSESESGSWSNPTKAPFWYLYGYYPSDGWGGSQAMFEVKVSLGLHATFFAPKIVTLYQGLKPEETKVMTTDTTVVKDEKEDPEEKDDDDPSLLDMTTFIVTEKEDKKETMDTSQKELEALRTKIRILEQKSKP